jgi:hypothetical protein
MTTSAPHPIRRLRRVAIAAIALGSVLPALGVSEASAAGRRSISPEIARVAGDALDLLRDLHGYDDVRSYNRTTIAYRRYVELRDEAATLAAAELGLDPVRLRDAWALADAEKQEALLAALTQLGVPYRSRTSQPGVGFDCSGLTTYAWGVAGLELPRQSGAQISQAAAIDRAAAEAGDLVYYPGHVMMYLGIDDAIVHSPQRGSEVEITFVTERRTNSVRFGDPTA